jgi:hypothetical protein
LGYEYYSHFQLKLTETNTKVDPATDVLPEESARSFPKTSNKPINNKSPNQIEKVLINRKNVYKLLQKRIEE